MPVVITDRDLRHGIENLIANATKYLIIVSPYIDLDDDMKKAFSKLQPEAIKGIVYRSSGGNSHKSGISDDSRTFFKSLTNVELISVNNLHSKFYINDEIMIISSMNLIQSSNHNYEMGVEIVNREDSEMAQDCLDYLFHKILIGKDSDLSIERLKNLFPKRIFKLDYSPTKVKINGVFVSVEAFKALHINCNTKHGYCIRCQSTNIEFYPNRPLCPKCFTEWSKFKNPNHDEKYCHRCGMEVDSTIDDPLCASCSEVYEFEIEREWGKTTKKLSSHAKIQTK